MTKKPEIVKEEDLIKRKDGLVYKKYAKVPFTGVYESFHEYGRLKEKGKTPHTYSNRQLESYQNYTNGHLKEKGIYKNGKPHGTFEWFKTNGQLEAKINYKDGKLDGLYELFYLINGQLRKRGNYKNGRQDGLWEIYYVNGQLRSKGHFKNGEIHGIYEHFDEEGNLTKSETWENGKVVE